MQRIILQVILSICLFSIVRAYASTNAEAQQTLQILLTQNDDQSVLNSILKLQDIKSKVNRLNPDFITECEIFPLNCRPDHVLLFRGQSVAKTPGLSGLMRSLWAGTSYVKDQDLATAINQLKNDISPLKVLLNAPNRDSKNPIEYAVFTQTDGPIWLSDEEEPIDLTPQRSGKRDDPFLNAKQILFTFHANETYLYFDDPTKDKKVLLDPLISFTSDARQAQTFAKGENGKGQFIVISVPKNELSTLCSDSILVGEVWNTRDCSDFLNINENANEYDVVGYIKPELIKASFIISKPDRP